jgi:hypothetical protein
MKLKYYDLAIPEDIEAALNYLVYKTKSNKSEIFEIAVKLLTSVVEQEEKGNCAAFIDKDNNIVQKVLKICK